MIPHFLGKLILHVIIKVRITELFDKPWILMQHRIFIKYDNEYSALNILYIACYLTCL